MSKKILITGGPGTGKTSLFKSLISDGFVGFEEKSREVITTYKKKGIDQLFLTNPLLFSDLLLESRVNQFVDSDKIKETNVFFDRGIPDVIAYLDFKKMKYGQQYSNACKNYRYDTVFILRPWKDIFVNDKDYTHHIAFSLWFGDVSIIRLEIKPYPKKSIQLAGR